MGQLRFMGHLGASASSLYLYFAIAARLKNEKAIVSGAKDIEATRMGTCVTDLHYYRGTPGFLKGQATHCSRTVFDHVQCSDVHRSTAIPSSPYAMFRNLGTTEL